ncbi:hypothetical protein BDZ91DRAFT_712050 [Kalaharituber pfeilii]|nr:hypothetical protein BDZ91DRAFT_712050 [Kalaharituber pfeilii]
MPVGYTKDLNLCRPNTNSVLSTGQSTLHDRVRQWRRYLLDTHNSIVGTGFVTRIQLRMPIHKITG